MLPDWTAAGLLPPGRYEATWVEIESRFGQNSHREELLAGLRDALDQLRAAGCGLVYLDGSFVTDKEVPNDYDMCWEMSGVDLKSLPPVFLDVALPRAAQQARYRGDILPNVTEAGSGAPFVDFFQKDKVTGGEKGIVLIDLRKEATS
jgi:hypothetical protein